MANPTEEARLRPAGRATRDAIAAAAKELFTEHGYDGASVRAIAKKAGIDAALVIRHFGSKEELFLEVIDQREKFAQAFEGPVDELGKQLIAIYLGEAGNDLRQTFLLLTGAAHHEKIRSALIERTREVIVQPLAARLDGENRETRVMLAMSAVSGLLTGLHIYSTPELVDADEGFLVETYGAAIQKILTP